jgi:predicted RND superfamily exporter protein
LVFPYRTESQLEGIVAMDRYFRFITERYRLTLTLVLIATLPFFYFYTKQRFFNHIEVYFQKDDPNIAYYKEFQKVFGNDQVAVIAFKDTTIFTAENMQLIRDITDKLKKIDGVQTVLSLTTVELPKVEGDTVEFKKLIPEGELDHKTLAQAKYDVTVHPVIMGNLLGQDLTATAIMAELGSMESNDQKRIVLDTIRDETEKVNQGRRKIYYSGSPFLEVEIDRLLISDNAKFLPILGVIVVVAIMILQRSLIVTLLTAFNVFLVSVWGIGFLIMSGNSINTVTEVIAPMLLAVAVAGCIHVLHHYKEALGQFRGDHQKAVHDLLSHLWRPALATMATNMVGYLSFLTTTVRPVQTVGIYTSVGILFSFFLAMTLLPSLLLTFQKLISKSFAPHGDWNLFHTKHQSDPIAAFMEKLGAFSVRHHRSIIGVFFVIIAISLYGMTKLVVETDFTRFLQEDNPLRQDITFIDNNVRGTAVLELVIHAKDKAHDFTTPESLEILDQVQTSIMRDMGPDFTTSFSIADYFKAMNRAFHRDEPEAAVIPKSQTDILDYYELADDDVLKRSISPDRMKARISFGARFKGSAAQERFQHYMESDVKKMLGEHLYYKRTGMAALYDDMDRLVKESQLNSFGSAFAVIFIMMFFVCRTFTLTVVSLIPNIWPVPVIFGIMGFFGIPLDTSTIMIASITIGIAVDDTIHTLTWYRRNLGAGMSREEAILKCFKDNGIAVVMISAVLASAYFVLTVGSVEPIIAFGGLTGLAMIVAVTGDLFLLPAVLMVIKPKTVEEGATDWIRVISRKLRPSS